MLNFNLINNLFNKYHPRIGEISGILVDIYRPNYAAVDNNPSLVYSQKRYRIDPAGASSFIEPEFLSSEPYDIFGDRSILQSGDILFSGSSLASADVMEPAVTVVHYQPVKALIGIRTSRRCHIVNFQNDDGSYNYVYQNVFFDWIGNYGPASLLTKSYSGDGQPVPTQKALLYTRANLDQEGMHLLETDGNGTPNGNVWFISEITYSGPLMALVLEAGWKR